MVLHQRVEHHGSTTHNCDNIHPAFLAKAWQAFSYMHANSSYYINTPLHIIPVHLLDLFAVLPNAFLVWLGCCNARVQALQCHPV
eukprot:7943-Heterococcus_DN1.PRE.3